MVEIFFKKTRLQIRSDISSQFFPRTHKTTFTICQGIPPPFTTQKSNSNHLLHSSIPTDLRNIQASTETLPVKQS